MTAAVWMTKPRWSVSHLVREDTGSSYVSFRTTTYGLTVCGRHVNVDELDPEPTGIDTIDRCPRCLKRAAEFGADGAS